MRSVSCCFLFRLFVYHTNTAHERARVHIIYMHVNFYDIPNFVFFAPPLNLISSRYEERNACSFFAPQKFPLGRVCVTVCYFFLVSPTAWHRSVHRTARNRNPSKSHEVVSRPGTRFFFNLFLAFLMMACLLACASLRACVPVGPLVWSGG